jgi:peptide subunit release factor 1 (eRF1)
LDFIYNNKETGTFAEFSVEELGDGISANEAIDAFMKIVKSFDDTKNVYLPESLLKLLEDEEIDLFMIAAYDKSTYKKIEQMLYVVQNDLIVVDEYKTKYRVEYIGKTKSIISIDMLDNLEIFNVPSAAIKKGTISIKDCKEELFGA